MFAYTEAFNGGSQQQGWEWYDKARTYLQHSLWQWGASNVYLLVLSSLKVNIAENLIIVMGL